MELQLPCQSGWAPGFIAHHCMRTLEGWEVTDLTWRGDPFPPPSSLSLVMPSSPLSFFSLPISSSLLFPDPSHLFFSLPPLPVSPFFPSKMTAKASSPLSVLQVAGSLVSLPWRGHMSGKSSLPYPPGLFFVSWQLCSFLLEPSELLIQDGLPDPHSFSLLFWWFQHIH